MAIGDFEVDKIEHSFVAHDKQTAALATATKAAVVGRNHVVCKVDASYSDSTISGLVQVLFGATVIAEKYIHAAGAIDFGEDGVINTDKNELVSATLASGGGAVVGTITMSGYTTVINP